MKIQKFVDGPVTGYVRNLELAGYCRMRERNDASSRVVFEGRIRVPAAKRLAATPHGARVTVVVLGGEIVRIQDAATDDTQPMSRAEIVAALAGASS